LREKTNHEEKLMRQNQHELGNELVVVAGGAGEIGERITRMFLQQGARVLVPSRSKEKLKALRISLKDVSTGELIPLETDVSTPQGLKTLTAAVNKEGVLRAAVSAVGSWWQGPISLEVAVDEIHRVFQGTFFSYVGLTQALIPALGPDTHFIKLNGILSLQAIPNVSALGPLRRPKWFGQDFSSRKRPHQPLGLRNWSLILLCGHARGLYLRNTFPVTTSLTKYSALLPKKTSTRLPRLEKALATRKSNLCRCRSKCQKIT
jgi:NAD(P)-dependent dehydrogenase (short-subunit alcohol dehydrogenase family)